MLECNGAAESDFVAVCAQLTPATQGMIGAEVLAAMKPHSVLINIARGEVIDEDALGSNQLAVRARTTITLSCSATPSMTRDDK